MEMEILDGPVRFRLLGISGVVENDQYGPTGQALMDRMWRLLKEGKVPNTGINHWVYLPDRKMFVGVEPQPQAQQPITAELEPREFSLPRYLKHVHVGPYQALPQKWRDLKAELANRGEVMSGPALEIYGHHCDDPAKLETTILIGLARKGN